MSCRAPVLDWNCDKQGCFNLKKRLKFSAFENGLPARMRSMSDIDGFYERNGYLCFIEAKDGVELNKAQRNAYLKMTSISKNIIVFCIDCDAETMAITSWYAIHDGQVWETEYGDTSAFCATMKLWSDMADNMHYEREKSEAMRAKKRECMGLAKHQSLT